VINGSSRPRVDMHEKRLHSSHQFLRVWRSLSQRTWGLCMSMLVAAGVSGCSSDFENATSLIDEGRYQEAHNRLSRISEEDEDFSKAKKLLDFTSTMIALAALPDGSKIAASDDGVNATMDVEVNRGTISYLKSKGAPYAANGYTAVPGMPGGPGDYRYDGVKRDLEASVEIAWKALTSSHALQVFTLRYVSEGDGSLIYSIKLQNATAARFSASNFVAAQIPAIFRQVTGVNWSNAAEELRSLGIY
jgi:hypothetical protein